MVEVQNIGASMIFIVDPNKDVFLMWGNLEFSVKKKKEK